MANDILGVSVSGLRVSQTALSTVGHNIANAGIEGYSRQRIEAVTNPATLQSAGYIGNGANVNSIERIVNQFVVDQLRVDTTLFSDLDGYHAQIRQLDNLLSDESTGLSSSLNKFFSAMQNGADDPTSIPARQLILSESENLADRFNSISSRMHVIEESVDNSLEVAVAQVSALAQNIAQLNLKISDALGVSNNASPNDLLDQRDEALKSLAALVPLQIFDQGNGQVNVVIGTGQTLVIGSQARSVSLAPSAENADKLDLFFSDGLNREAITSVIKGGEIGGLIRFRDEVLDSVHNQLGRVAVVMADTFNQFHQQGVDLNNEFGGLFFYDINGEAVAANRVIGNSNNARPDDREMSLYIRDSQAISTSDYRVEIEGGALYRITRIDDQVQVASGLMPGQFPFSVEFDGLALEFAQGSFQNGDEFLLLPTRAGGRDFESALISAEDLAFGSPLLTDASLSNTGNGVISSGEVLSLISGDGDTLPLFAEHGEMSPPMIVVFNTPYSYDILDNSDPGNPQQLQPPIRDQRYIPGVTKQLFATDINGTMVSTNGDMVGLPEGRAAVTQASLYTAGSPPDFTTTDFSLATNQFAFDLVLTNTLSGSNDGSFTVTINGAAIADNDTLLATINAQLSGSDVRAYIADDGGLAFRLRTAGYGNITLQNYDNDPDGGGAAAAGLANNLLGFDIEGSTYSTVNNADGTAGVGLLTNGYPAEAITISRPSTKPGADPVRTTLFTSLNASAKELANDLSNQPGVEANAFNYIELSDFQLTRSEPLQVQLNGQNLIEYSVDSITGQPVLSAGVPDPVNDESGFYQYLADRINSSDFFQTNKISAVAGEDAIIGGSELRIFGSEGDDFNIALTAAAGEAINVGDGENSPVALAGAGNSVSSRLVVGGRVDVSLAEGIELSTFAPTSMIFGDTRAANFAQNTFWGIQASIDGSPEAGDSFNLDFNRDGAMDNRNILKLVNLQNAKTANGAATFSQTYGTLVERIGIETNSAKINRDAADRVLRQSEELRNSISGVNLDEEAADLIRFEQLFSANAQVISVARDIFERLISSF